MSETIDLGPVNIDDEAAVVDMIAADAQPQLIMREYVANMIQNQKRLRDMGLTPFAPYITRVRVGTHKKITFVNEIAPNTDPRKLALQLMSMGSGEQKRIARGGTNFGIGCTVMSLIHSPYRTEFYITAAGVVWCAKLWRKADGSTGRTLEQLSGEAAEGWADKPNQLHVVLWGKAQDHNTVRTPFKNDRSLDWAWPAEQFYTRFFDFERTTTIFYTRILSPNGERGQLRPIAERMAPALGKTAFVVKPKGRDVEIVYIWDEAPRGSLKRVAPYPILGVVWRPDASSMSEIYDQRGDKVEGLKTPGYFLSAIDANEARENLSILVKLPDGGNVNVTQHRESIRNKNSDLNETIEIMDYAALVSAYMPAPIRARIRAKQDHETDKEHDARLNELVKSQDIEELTFDTNTGDAPAAPNDQKTDKLKSKNKGEKPTRYADGAPAGFILPRRKTTSTRKHPQGGSGSDPFFTEGAGATGRPSKRPATPPNVRWYGAGENEAVPAELDFASWSPLSGVIHANADHKIISNTMLPRAQKVSPQITRDDIKDYLKHALREHALTLMLEVQTGALTAEQLMKEARVVRINGVASGCLPQFLRADIKEMAKTAKRRAKS